MKSKALSVNFIRILSIEFLNFNCMTRKALILSLILSLLGYSLMQSQTEKSDCPNFSDLKDFDTDKIVLTLMGHLKERDSINAKAGGIVSLFHYPDVLNFESGCDFPTNHEDIEITLGILIQRPNSQLILEINSHPSELEKYPGINLKRGKTVSKIFAHYGIKENRIHIQDYGALRPWATNESEYGRSINRYVALTIR
ncbi:hypothetical protein [Flagellimonas sp. S3867]|uniref:hypothetical protein n=1 Tax=Flagellimonas sp. S3867 TaxID=2768063 RepID=UPI001686C2F0|nr:hypothetical protein [Flagellimonas sp. S3867]